MKPLGYIRTETKDALESGITVSAVISATEFAGMVPVFMNDSWISVNDRLPDRYVEVLVFPPPNDYCLTASYGYTKGLLAWKFVEYEAGFGQVEYMCKPTHWMPIPQPPQEREK